MRQIYFATTNKGKVQRLNEALNPHSIEVVQVELHVLEYQSNDLVEIARQKAIFACEKIGKPVIAVDAGFYVNCFKDFPGAYTKFILDTIGVEGILKLVEGRDRGCYYRNCLAYMQAGFAEPIIFESEPSRGYLADAPRINRGEGRNWSGLQTVFIPVGYTKTEAEMTEIEYHSWRKSREEQSFSTRFARWFVQNQ